MIEVLVAVLVVGVGVFGLVKLQRALQAAEAEALQRTQALLLLNDMASRMEINVHHAKEYLTDTALGSGMRCAGFDPASAPLHRRDSALWCRALQGAAEQRHGNAVGTLAGGRGCIQELEDGNYLLTVAWQGSTPLSAPPDGIDCGAGKFDQPPGSACADAPDACRRFVSTRLGVATALP